jgi:hypothetical protein
VPPVRVPFQRTVDWSLWLPPKTNWTFFWRSLEYCAERVPAVAETDAPIRAKNRIFLILKITITREEISRNGRSLLPSEAESNTLNQKPRRNTSHIFEIRGCVSIEVFEFRNVWQALCQEGNSETTSFGGTGLCFTPS